MAPDDKKFVWVLWILVGLSIALGLIILFVER